MFIIFFMTFQCLLCWYNVQIKINFKTSLIFYPFFLGFSWYHQCRNYARQTFQKLVSKPCRKDCSPRDSRLVSKSANSVSALYRTSNDAGRGLLSASCRGWTSRPGVGSSAPKEADCGRPAQEAVWTIQKSPRILFT